MYNPFEAPDPDPSPVYREIQEPDEPPEKLEGKALYDWCFEQMERKRGEK
jgi:hypothetical protein